MGLLEWLDKGKPVEDLNEEYRKLQVLVETLRKAVMNLQREKAAMLERVQGVRVQFDERLRQLEMRMAVATKVASIMSVSPEGWLLLHRADGKVVRFDFDTITWRAHRNYPELDEAKLREKAAKKPPPPPPAPEPEWDLTPPEEPEEPKTEPGPPPVVIMEAEEPDELPQSDAILP